MAAPNNGKASKLVTPAAPRDAQEADKSDPGEVQEIRAEQMTAGTGKYGSTRAKPFKPSQDSSEAQNKTAWIEIELKDEDGDPVSGQRYEVTLPDGSIATGTLDGDGVACVEGFDPGSCQVTFPDLDGRDWKKV